MVKKSQASTIRDQAKKLGFSQIDLADICRMTPAAINRMLKGIDRLSWNSALHLSVFLDVEAKDLFLEQLEITRNYYARRNPKRAISVLGDAVKDLLVNNSVKMGDDFLREFAAGMVEQLGVVIKLEERKEQRKKTKKKQTKKKKKGA